MAKRKRIIKYLKYAYEQNEKEYTKNGQITIDNFHLGVLFGIKLTEMSIKNKRDKKCGF